MQLNAESSILSLLPHKAVMLELICDIVKEADEGVLWLLQIACDDAYNKQFTSCLQWSKQILDFAWEKLNSYNWKDVNICWRKMYSVASLLKAISIAMLEENHLESSKNEEVCKACDMGLLMGAPILNDILNKCIAFNKHVGKRKRKLRYGFTHQGVGAPVDVPESETQHNNDKSNKVQSEECCLVRNTIPQMNCPSLETFHSSFMKLHRPVLLMGCLHHWPAANKWSLNYLKKVAGHRTVPVEVGARYTDDSWGQKLMTINDFISNYIESASVNSPTGYLAQHQLFDQIPELREDICVPDYCCISSCECALYGDRDDEVEINAWFGPKGTISPCHYDPKHNLLAQVVGRKYVRMYEPEACSKALYPHRDGSMLTNTSMVDVEHPDTSRFPLFAEVDAAHAQTCILRPGQMLYIPPKHWHYVRSLDQSMSVSFWW